LPSGRKISNPQAHRIISRDFNFATRGRRAFGTGAPES
jgi:hypothetical protein